MLRLSIIKLRFTGFFAAMGKAGGGRNEVDPRFMSMFSVYNMTFPSDNTVSVGLPYVF